MKLFRRASLLLLTARLAAIGSIALAASHGRWRGEQAAEPGDGQRDHSQVSWRRLIGPHRWRWMSQMAAAVSSAQYG